jgi:Dolichyl-phosphate-mannose-protein mannosyltransferase
MMPSDATGRPTAQTRPPFALLTLGALALLLALWLEVWVQRGDAFWLDESWTGAIVGQRSWLDTFHQIYWDVNAPLYYLLLHLWQGVFGLSDAALRAPSLICAVLTPLAFAVLPVEGLPRAERVTWAALTALWFPGLCFAQEARCYSLLLLVCGLQTLAFLRLMHRPDIGRAAMWAALGAAAILTHYDAILLGAAQGLVYLAVHRMRAVRTWPAALLFLPAFGWLLFHLPRIQVFTRPDIAWYAPLRPSQLWSVAGYIAGREPQLWALAFIATGALTVRFAWPGGPRNAPIGASGGWAVLASAAGAAVLILVGFFRPSFTYRYLTPFAPGLLLGFVLLVRSLGGRRAPVALAALIIAFGALSGWALQSQHFRMAPRRYNFERASRELAMARPARLVFLWDHPVDPVLHREQLSALGGFFLHRNGLPIPVDPVILKPGEDPNARLLEEAAAPGSAILWLYDTVVRGTAANRFRPDIDQRDRSWRCRQYGWRRFGVLGCTRFTAPER